MATPKIWGFTFALIKKTEEIEKLLEIVNNCDRLAKEIGGILSNLPDGLKVDWNMAGDLIQFIITKKPIGYSKEKEERLLSDLNAAVLSFQGQDMKLNEGKKK